MKDGDKPLTHKQRVFVQELQRNGGNKRQAALKAYNVKKPETASVMAHETLNKPNVKRAIIEVMEKAGLTDEYLMKRTKDIVDSDDLDTAAKGIKIAKDIKGLDAPKELDNKTSGNITISWASGAPALPEPEEEDE